MMTGIVYTRVSTKEQVDEGNSLETQLRLCNQYAERNDIAILKDGVFREEGESAKTVNRTQLQKMLAYCASNKDKIDVIIIYRIDRLSREASDYLELKAFFSTVGIRIHSVSEKIEDNPVGRFIENVLASSAQLDNEIRAERSKNGMIDAVREGRYPWKAPYGYINTRVNGMKNIAPGTNEELLNLIREAWTLIDCGYSEMDALRTLRNKGLVGVNGKPMRIQHLSKMYRNPIYKAVITQFDLNIISSEIIPIIEPELWDRVYEKLTGKRKRPPKYRKLNPDYPLRGDLLCKAGHRMTGSAPRGVGGVYPQYHCPKCRGKGTSFNRDKLNASFVEYLDAHEYPSQLNEALREAFKLNLEDELKVNKKQRTKLDKQLAEIDMLDLSITKKNISRVYSDEHTKKMLASNNLERTNIKLALNDLDIGLDDAEEIVEFGFDTIARLGQTWNSTDNMVVKQKFQKWVFPAGFSYDGEKFGTSQTALCLSIKKDLHEDKSLLVIPRRVELLLPG